MKPLVCLFGFPILFGALGGCSLANTEPPPKDIFFRLDFSHNMDGSDPSDLSKGKDAAAIDQGNPGPSSTLVVNEVFPHGPDSVTDPDFIELYNAGSGQVTLRGYKVRDDNTTWYPLPDDAVIPAGGFYVIHCDGGSGSTLPGAHVNFKLGGSADEVHLAFPDGTEVDQVRWGNGASEIPKDQSFGRVPDHSGPFTVLPKPSRGKPNG